MCTEAPPGMPLPCLPVGMLQGGVGPAGSLHYHTHPCATKTPVEGILFKWSFFFFVKLNLFSTLYTRSHIATFNQTNKIDKKTFNLII